MSYVLVYPLNVSTNYNSIEYKALRDWIQYLPIQNATDQI